MCLMIKGFLRQLFDTSVAASNPALTLSSYLPKPPRGKTIVVGAGILKIPQIIKILSASSVEGLSAFTLYIEVSILTDQSIF